MEPAESKILIVEDEEEIGELLCDLLHQDGYACDVATNGDEAIKILESTPYDLVITDIHMPGKNGLDVLRFAKERWDDVIVILLTGHGSMESAINSLRMGASDYLLKPFNNLILLKTIRTNLHNQYLERENKRLQRQAEIDREQLRKRVTELNILRQLSINLSYTFDFSYIFSLILDSLSQIIEFDICASLDLVRHEIVVLSKQPLHDNVLAWVRQSLIASLHEHPEVKLFEGRLQIHTRHSEDGKIFSDIPVSNMRVVVEGKGTLFGILQVSRIADIPFLFEDHIFLSDLANVLADVFVRLKEVIESQRSKLQFIVDNLPDGVIFFDQKDDSVILNPMARRMIDRRASRLITKIDVERRLNVNFANLIDEVQRNGKPIIKPIVLGAGQSVCFLDAHIGHLPNPDGLPIGLIMVFRDVTRERTLEQMKIEFISNVSHELRTPVAIIKEFVSLIKDELGGPINKVQREYIETIQRNIERLLRMIENLLLSSRLEFRQEDLQLKRTNIILLLQTLGKEFLVRFAQKKITFKEHFPDYPIEVDIDTDALTHIVFNLLENARKYSSSGSIVTIGVEEQGDDVVLFVADQGRGIAPEHLDKIFERFYRIESLSEARLEGSGLGLAVVKELVVRHHGTIWVESQINEGSTFFVKIPKHFIPSSKPAVETQVRSGEKVS